MAQNQSQLRHWASEGIPLVAETFGNPGRPPAIFVHGGGQSRFAWRSGARAAASAGLYALAVDQRGHGDSGWALDGDYSPGAMAGDLQLLMRELGRPAILVGASRGGYATLVAAARADPAVRALVLVEIAPRIDRSGAAQVRGFMRASAAGFASIEEAAELLGSYMQRTEGKDSERLRRSMRQDQSGRWFWRWDPKVASGSLDDPSQAERELEEAARKTDCPVLLVRGERSELVKAEHAAHLQALIPGTEVVTIPGVGHMVSGDENDLFNAAIMEFIAGLPPIDGECGQSARPRGGVPVMATARAVNAQ